MGEQGITISDKTEVKVAFDDVDLISDEEKAALEEDIDGEGEGEAAAGSEAEANAKADADEAAKRTAQEDQDAKDAEKEAQAKIKLADEKIEAEKAAAHEKAKAGSADGEAAAAGDLEAGKTGGEGEGTEDADGDQEVPLSKTPPPVTMASMTEDEIAKVQGDLDAARKKFQDGEIDYDTYFEERLGLERQLWANDVAVQLSSDGVENQWKWEQQTFLTEEGNAWINDDEVVYSAFAATVNRIMSTEEGAVMPGPELLAQAREEVAARFSPTREADSAAAEEKRKADEALANAKKAQGDKTLPTTLSKIPVADQEDGVGEFDYLDKLDGEAYEKAVEGLSEAQLSRYEAIQ